MIPWPLIWALVPKKYLIAAAALVAVLVGGYAAVRLYGSHREATGYHAGSVHVADSVSAIAIKRIAATETVYVKSAVRADSQVVAVAHGHPAQHLVIQPVTVRDSAVRVIVEAFHDTVENVPVRAAHYWKQADSTAGLALQSASQWHAAYLSADSIAALYADRLLRATAPPSVSHRRRDLVFTALGAVAGFVIARHIR